MVRRVRAVLVVVVAAAVLAAGALMPRAYAAEKNPNVIVMDGSTTVGPLAKAFATYYMSKHPGVNVTVSESGSGNGAKSLVNNACDIANMSRFMKDTEFKDALANGVMPVATVVALDGVAIIVHPSNPVKNLTLDQVRDIYSGKVTNWKDVGGPDLQIVMSGRETSSGTYEVFGEKVMRGEKIAASAETVGSNGAMHQKVQSTQAGIGYVGLGFVDETVKAVTVNGIECTRATIVSGRYPIARPLFMFTNGYPEMGSNIYSFLNLYLTRDGQAIVQQVGYIPVTSY
jgi:phosphate transport system substrate-binding protein